MNEIELLHQLVAIPSLSGAEHKAAEFLATAMTSLGLSSSIDEVGNAVGIRECPDEYGQISMEIVLLGHMDTVPGDIPVRIEEGILYGRGAVDAKGPLAAFIVAASRANLPPGTRVVVVGAVEEESATSNGARHVAARYQPDLCIIGEPSGWDGVTLGYKGRILMDYELRQPMGHSAGKERGVAETAVAWWNELSAIIEIFNQDKDKIFDQLLPSLRHIQTDSDGLNNQALIKVGIRLPPDFDIDTFTKQAVELADDASLKVYAFEPAFHSSRLSLLARAFNQALRQASVRPRFKLKTGTSDMNVVGPIWNCPIVAYGPGDSGLDHTPNEHIVLTEYVKAIEILQAVLANKLFTGDLEKQQNNLQGEME